jgi:hypothetical protein
MRWSPFLALGLAACSQSEVPSERLVDRIESKLSANACIGSLARWNRQYRFWREQTYDSPHRGEVDYNRVDFELWQAGRFGIKAGRSITLPEDVGTFRVDDRPIDLAMGDYDIKSDRLSIIHCGPNLPGTP